MIVEFLGKQIIKCPDTYKKVKITKEWRDITIIKTTHYGTDVVIELKDYSNVASIDRFMDSYIGARLDERAWKIFMDELGFVPFCELQNQEYVYVETYQYKTVEEMKAQQKPIVMTEFMGVSIPLAIYNEMRTLTNMKESSGSLADFAFPPNIEQYVQEALTKLTYTRNAAVTFCLRDMAVYDFLDMLHIFKGHAWFFSGDKMYPYNVLNLYKAGYFDDPSIEVWYEFANYSGIKYNDPLLTDTIVEASSIYHDMESSTTDYEDMEYRCNKLLYIRKGFPFFVKIE